MESFLVNIIPGAYTSTYSFLLLIAWKMNFDSSRQPLVFFLLSMFCNDWIPFCLRNLFLSSVYRGQTKRKWSSFSTWFWQNTQFLFVGQSLYLYILLFIGSTSSRSCVSATLKQYISITDKYSSAPNITLKDRYISYLSLPLTSAVHSWVNMSNNLCLKTYKNYLTSPMPCCNHTK